MSEAADAGVDITTQNFTISWDFIQAIFFSTTILTTIGNKLGMETLKCLDIQPIKKRKLFWPIRLILDLFF